MIRPKWRIRDPENPKNQAFTMYYLARFSVLFLLLGHNFPV